MFGVMAPPADSFIEDPDKVADIVGAAFMTGRSAEEEIDQLYVESKAVATDDDVVGVQIAVVLARSVNLLDASRQRVEQVHSGKRR